MCTRHSKKTARTSQAPSHYREPVKMWRGKLPSINQKMESNMRFVISAMLAVALSCAGCASTSAKQTVENIRKATDVVTAICDSVEIFESIDLETPGSEQCKNIVPLFNAEQFKQALSVAECMAHPDNTDADLFACAGNEGMRLARSLYELSKKKLNKK